MEEIRVEIKGHKNPPAGKAIAIHSKVLDVNPRPKDHGLGNPRHYDVKVEGIEDGNATVIISHPAISNSPPPGKKWDMLYFHEEKYEWLGARFVGVEGQSISGEIPVEDLQKTPIVIGTH